jgi:hypothetical protein
MDPLHLFWIIPVCVLVGYLFEYFFEVYPYQKSEEELIEICQQCWHKWTLGIQEDDPGLKGVWRRHDVNYDEVNKDAET